MATPLTRLSHTTTTTAATTSTATIAAATAADIPYGFPWGGSNRYANHCMSPLVVLNRP